MRILQIILPFFIAGLGTCFAGVLLDRVQFWKVFTDVEELFIILPAILGLKGNLQMTLASRLSTHSHLGHIQTIEDLLSLTCANLSLNQCLSIVISFSASLLAITIHATTSTKPFDYNNALLITATALLASSVTSFILDILMIMVVHVSAIYGVNPDNVAIPIAASLGDMTALLLCSFIGDAFYFSKNSAAFYWLTSSVIILYIILVPIWANVTQDNVHTHNVLFIASHWYPLITAMAISSISGVILKSAIDKSQELSIALFQPVICGIGGNLVAVQASRLSTLLHRNQTPGILPEGEKVCMNPLNVFTSGKSGYSITRLLMLIVMPGQLVFYFICVYVSKQATEPSVPFLLMYLIASQIHVSVLLYLAYVFTYGFWKIGIDPDNSTIPYLTSISDVLGASIMTVICVILEQMRETHKRDS